MSNISYFEKLKDPRWQRKRLEVMQHHNFCCELCGNDELTQHVHHKTYIKGREPWDYECEQLSLLCESCHSEEHKKPDHLKIIESFLPLDGLCNREEIAQVVLAYIHCEYPLLGEKISSSIDDITFIYKNKSHIKQELLRLGIKISNSSATENDYVLYRSLSDKLKNFSDEVGQ